MGTPAASSLEDLTNRVAELERLVRDHEQRFDTLQTNLPRRLWWWARWGCPLIDLNATRPHWRPWNRDRLWPEQARR